MAAVLYVRGKSIHPRSTAMKRTIVRYGLIGAAILIGINVVILLILGIPEGDDYAMGEVIGYSTIVVALVPVFLAIKYYRDRHPEEALGFWRALGLGTAVAVFPSAAFALYNWVYVTWIDPAFNEKYYRHMLEQAQAGMSPSEFAAYSTQLEAQQAMFANPIMMGVIMFITVFLIGVLIAFVSALALQRRRRSTEAA